MYTTSLYIFQDASLRTRRVNDSICFETIFEREVIYSLQKNQEIFVDKFVESNSIQNMENRKTIRLFRNIVENVN